MTSVTKFYFIGDHTMTVQQKQLTSNMSAMTTHSLEGGPCLTAEQLVYVLMGCRTQMEYRCY